MSMSLALKIGFPAGSSTERLARVLKQNQNKFVVSKDGFISIDLNNIEVITEIERQLEKLKTLEKDI